MEILEENALGLTKYFNLKKNTFWGIFEHLKQFSFFNFKMQVNFKIKYTLK